MTGQLRSSWDELLRTLQDVAPATAAGILVGATEPAIAEAQRGCPNVWPDELAEYFRIQGGQPPGAPGEVIPLHRLLSLDDAMQARAELIEQFPPSDEASPSTVAGQAQYYFAAAYIPLAESDGSYLFCDTREGVHKGQVGEFSADAADEDNQWWPSLAEMAIEIESALRGGGPVRWFSPRMSAGTLDWLIEDDSARYRSEHDAMHSHYLEHPEGNISPVQFPQTDGVDLMQVQRNVLALAAETYGAANLTQIMMSTDYLPRVPGRQAVCAVAVKGALRGYTITVTDEDGTFSVEPPPYV